MGMNEKLTEREFTRMVLELAKMRGWRTAHFRPARTEKGWRTAVSGDGVGFPDLVMVRGGRLIFAELKVGKNKLSAAQERWLAELRNAATCVTIRGANNVMAVEWRPEDWKDIEYFLE